MAEQELLNLIYHGGEERNLEYKASLDWNDAETKAKIVKATLAIANVRDGGTIVLGVENDGANPTGMQPNHAASFNQDDVAARVNAYADPFVELTVRHVTDDNKEFVIIQVQEFAELPVICKKSSSYENIRKGAIYTRTRRIYETAEVPSQTEMREIIELATEKGIQRIYRILGKVGIVGEITDVDRNQFDDQLGSL